MRPWYPMIVLALAACAAQRTPAPPTTNVVTINATDFAFAATDTIVAGQTTFRMINAGREPHQAVITGSATKSFEELERALMMADSRIPDWLVFPAAPGVVVAGDSSIVTSNVTPGNYVIVCFIPSPDGKPHVAKGMVRRLVVVPAPQAAAAPPEPKADVTVTLSDYAFALSVPLTAGTHTIRVENAGPQLHELTIERLLPGKTLADFQKWVAGGMRGTPPVEAAGGLVGPDKGTTGWLSVTLTPGNYLLNCYVPDAKDGKPHFLHGMVQQITVT